MKSKSARITSTRIANPSNTKFYKLFIGFGYAVKEKFQNIELQLGKSISLNLAQF